MTWKFVSFTARSGRVIVTLRDGTSTCEVGYTRSVQRLDGKIVTVHYFNDAPHNERFIAATIWDPNP